MRVHVIGLIAIAGIFIAALNAQSQSGFIDGHSDGTLLGWTTEGARGWTEKDGVVQPATGPAKQTFLISSYPSSDNGTIEANIIADAWNGFNGGIVVRWTSPTSYYYIAVKPGNIYSNALYLCKNTLDIASGRVLASNFPMTSNVTLKIVAHGNTLSVYVNGTLRGTFTDTSSPLLAGRVGYAQSTQWNPYVKFDNVSWTDEPGSTPTMIPAAPIQMGTLVVHYKDEGINENNIIKARIFIENTGTVAAKDFMAFFYFKAAPGKTVVLEDYYTPDANVTLEKIAGDNYRITFDYPGIILGPGDVTPDRSGSVIGIHYSDWTPIDKAGSFSYSPTGEFVPTPKIPIVTPGVNGTPLSGTMPPVTVTRLKMTLNFLKCNETEDFTGADECILDVLTEGALRTSFRHDLNDGDVFTLGNSFIFTNNAEVRLTDEDNPSIGDDNDFLGTVVANTTPGTYTGKFTGDGADYDLNYTIEQVTETVPGTQTITLRTLVVNQLKCNETEDFTGADECELTIALDGRQFGGLQRDLNDGQVWLLNLTYTFDKVGKITLFDIDTDIFDDDDNLGTVTLDTAPGVHTGKFTGDGADYDLTYTISTTTKIISTRSDEETALIDFTNSTTPGIWPHILRSALAADMGNKIRGLSLPEQFNQPLCGPAAIMYALVKRNPLRYIDMCRSVFEQGVFNARSKTYSVDPDEDVIKSLVPTPFVAHQADWMLMAFLRDEANWFFDVTNDGSAVANGVTTLDEMEEWTTDILGYPHVENETSFIWGELGLLDDSRKAQEAGGVAFFLVDADLVKGEDTWISFPDHWIALSGDVTINNGTWYEWDSGHVKVKVFSWGDENHILDVTEGVWEDNFFGAVIGR